MHSRLILLVILFLGNDFLASAQLNWVSKSSVPRYGRHEAVSFVLDGKGYFGLGRQYDGTNLKDFWQYNPDTDEWKKIQDFPGGALFSATSFVIGNKGYVCLGQNGTTSVKTLWEYDPVYDQWNQRANFPSNGRYGAGSFVIDNVAYVGCGSESGIYHNDLYSYDPQTNNWTKRASFPGAKSINITSFTLNDYGYFGNGKSRSNDLTDKFWKYNASNDSWEPIAPMPGMLRRITSAFVINNRAYVGCGTNSGTYITDYANDFYVYDYQTNSWTHQPSNLNFVPRISAHHFVFGDTAVYTVGGYGENGSLADLWKLTHNSDTCLFVDTVYHQVFDTTSVYDTLIVKMYLNGCGEIEISIYPNPTSEVLNVFSRNDDCLKGKEIILFDDIGQIVRSQIINSQNTSFDIKVLTAGLYVLRITDSDGKEIVSKKIIVE